MGTKISPELADALNAEGRRQASLHTPLEEMTFAKRGPEIFELLRQRIRERAARIAELHRDTDPKDAA